MRKVRLCLDLRVTMQIRERYWYERIKIGKIPTIFMRVGKPAGFNAKAGK